MLSAIMTDPFATVAPATLLASIKAVQAVLANCWPRFPQSPWQDEIINALVLCWLNLVNEDSPNLAPVRASLMQELVRSAEMLSAVLKTGNVSLSAEVAPLVEKEPSLAGLFSS